MVSPGTPGWTLNETTDLLLKKEFDECRSKQIPHRLFEQYGLGSLVPFKHPDIDRWRNSLHYGLMSRFQDTNIILTGGVDDVWQDTKDGSLIVVDYKSQANSRSLTAESYLADPYHYGYRVQMDFYSYLLQEMGFSVSDISYFLVCNANRSATGFFGTLEFSETIIPYHWTADWIPVKVTEMISLMNQTEIPDGNDSCVNCASARERRRIEHI